MTINHESHDHGKRTFPGNNAKRARKGGPLGKPLPEGSRATVNWDVAHNNMIGSHVIDDHLASMATQGLHRTIETYEREGRASAAKKAKRALNNSYEVRLAVRSSWCSVCVNYLHNCICPATADARGASAASISFMDMVNQHLEAKDNDRREAILDQRQLRRRTARLQRKAAERAAKGSN